ncbi:MAG: hydroxymethylbilane synthase [Pseudomonadales bacterium]|nr:hydroxymethylbilane synthase [Pseudomonadales bacterium]
MNTLTIATRESALALWQANYVRDQLQAAHPGLEVIINGMTTQGDRDKQSPLSQMGGKGVFVKELEVALMENRADIAVHSMKDVPSELPEGLVLQAICIREDPSDAFVSNNYSTFASLPAGARVGSSSLRRRLQLQALRPDLTYLELRGNVPTRLQKLDDGEFEAIILATAGLKRLGLGDRVTESIDTAVSIPAAGQGAVGIECRAGDTRVTGLLEAINHQDTYLRVMCEREISTGLGANCNLPIAAFAELDGDTVTLSAYVNSPTGDQPLKVIRRGPAAEGQALAREVTRALLDQGAGDLLARHP